MRDPRIVRFYLNKDLKKRAARGEHNFLNRFCAVLERAGFRTAFHVLTESERLKSASRPGYAVYLMQPPMTARGLTIRKNYIYPFWKIESDAERWDWPVARAIFDPHTAPQPEAKRFTNRWRKKLFGESAEQTRRDGFVYVPLQGHLLDHRSFQSCSPIEMLEQIATLDRDRAVVATLHPGEDYTPAERDALTALMERTPRLKLTDQSMIPLLQGCDYVATQNSSVALSGYFFHKPAALFARIDFHHIAANVHDLGVEKALRQAPHMTPDYDAYLWWFLQDQSINAGHPDGEAKIEAALRRAGWIT
ncbi:hypothetical protein E2K80_03155 [Rhodophyticola sp. CCM32]|uniref:hypothetical protein n=1 Tax=Rhodophyticola sp. CCM32 TaxID=2916397 RepID=UPI00107F5F94|nr:hypothetical protein [Rhodophyticola sp. CCM32]QBX99852.1 hypothetical protein E2K80_03155 [Rhodophyticola sp. CCM32]